MSLRDELFAAIESWDLDLGENPTEETSLIGSGLLDSVALFNLIVWVEQQTGSPLDPTTFDIATEWDTVGGILRFVEARRGGGGPS